MNLIICEGQFKGSTLKIIYTRPCTFVLGVSASHYTVITFWLGESILRRIKRIMHLHGDLCSHSCLQTQTFGLLMIPESFRFMDMENAHVSPCSTNSIKILNYLGIRHFDLVKRQSKSHTWSHIEHPIKETCFGFPFSVTSMTSKATGHFG